MKTCIVSLFCLLFFSDVFAQKGKNSISLGLFYSNPLEEKGFRNILKPGIGAEFTFEARFQDHSAILLQGGFASHKNNEEWIYKEEKSIKIISARVAYRYYLKPEGFYLNAGPGIDYYTQLEPMGISISGGSGRRFLLTEKYFLDAGLEYIDGSTERRLQVKMAIGTFPRRKKTIIVK